jgi:hypothetical protein
VHFEVKTEKETVKLDRFSLLELLLSKVMQKPKDEFNALSTALSHNLQGKSVLSQFNIDQLIVTSFSLGYYYRVFMDKNNVNIVGEENELANEDNIESTSKDNSS